MAESESKFILCTSEEWQALQDAEPLLLQAQEQLTVARENLKQAKMRCSELLVKLHLCEEIRPGACTGSSEAISSFDEVILTLRMEQRLERTADQYRRQIDAALDLVDECEEAVSSAVQRVSELLAL